MQVNMTKKWRHWALCIVLAIGSVVAAWSLDKFPDFQILNLKVDDAHFVVRYHLLGPPPISNIVLLTANQETMDRFAERVAAVASEKEKQEFIFRVLAKQPWPGVAQA